MPGVSDSAGLTEADAAVWRSAIPIRHARRSYTGEPVADEDLEQLAALCERWHPFEGARVAVVAQAPAAVFFGVVGAYGGISHAPSALVFIATKDAALEAVGYTGEALVLEATARGLDTCWVAGLFDAGAVGRVVSLEPGERVLAVSALGHAVGQATTKERLLFGGGRPKKRRALEEIAPGHASWPAWARAAVEAAQVAPSAMNRQPWRFSLGASGLEVSVTRGDTPRASKRLDCGIAMLHAELGASAEGVRGRWEPLGQPGVARFVPGTP